MDSRFEEATVNAEIRTLADALEEIITNEFIELTPIKDGCIMKSKPVRSTAGKER